MLEECKIPYKIIPVNIGKGDQFKPSFLKISPNNRIPAIIDPNGPGGKPISVFESGAPDSKTDIGLPPGPLGSIIAGILLFGDIFKNEGLN